ncbi:MAG TPA: SIMPL domain-containing protein [Flavobacteriaceae bacterium]|nr:SIMPL domain-containing protein [Flavobacteriaceae bacterium]
MKHLLITLAFISFGISAQEIQPMVSVTGEGTVKIIPDQVTVRFSIENSGKEVKDVKSKNDQTTHEVLAALKKMKIADKDIQTQHVRLNKTYDYQSKTYLYSASQTIVVLLRDLNNYDNVMMAILNAGINRIESVSFGVSNMEELQAEARLKAVKNAKIKATAYASELGQEIGKAIVISENTSNPFPPTPAYRLKAMDAAMGMEEAVETLAVGEMSIKAKVHVSFYLL